MSNEQRTMDNKQHTVDKEVAIKIENISKTFKLPHEKQSSLKNVFLSSFRRNRYEVQRAVNNVSFEVKKGEFFGIVGRNGSGKSTLLKLIAGIYTPDKGKIEINGILTPFIELGVGFNPELSGRDNVFLNGALFGKSRKEMEALYDEIIEFAELERFMDQKLKNYSSGMQVRLAFSIAIQIQSDILLIDEVLAVGDESFKRKCFEYFETIKLASKTVVFVTHDMNAVRQFCNRVILVDNGKVLKVGKPDYIAERYSQINLEESAHSLQRVNAKAKMNNRMFGNGKAKITSIWTTDHAGTPKNTFSPRELITVHVELTARLAISKAVFGIVFTTSDGKNIFATNTHVQKVSLPAFEAKDKMVVKVEVPNIFNDGFYTISAALTDSKRQEVYSRVLNLHKFEVGGWELTTALAHPSANISATIMSNVKLKNKKSK